MRFQLIVSLTFLTFAALASDAGGFKLKTSDGQKYAFSILTDAQSFGGYFGSYEAPRSYTNGTSVKLYPNMRFTVMEWCDICMPTRLASGTYSFKRGLIEFSYSYKDENAKPDELPSSLMVYHGWIEKKGYVTGFKLILVKPEDVQAAAKDQAFEGYLAQEAAYPDWQRMYDEEVSEK